MRWGMYQLLLGIACILSTSTAQSRRKRSILKKKLTISSHEFSQSKKANASQLDAPPITVWIHGTRFIWRPIFKNFFHNKPGLKLAQDLAPDYYLHKVSKALNKTAPHIFPMDTLYLFGWSGKLRDKIRVEAAQVLYNELQRIIKEYKATYNTSPVIRLIGHSHGGNVALYLGKMKQPTDEPLHIKELILLACPVQQKTKKYIEDEIFDHTYALYSTLDMVQVLAPQVAYTVYRTKRGHLRTEMKWNFLSRRTFEHHPKLAQIKIKINGRALFHSEFTHQKFVSLLPHILHVINTWDIDYNHPPDTKKLLSVYTRKQQKFNERKVRVHA